MVCHPGSECQQLCSKLGTIFLWQTAKKLTKAKIWWLEAGFYDASDHNKFRNNANCELKTNICHFQSLLSLVEPCYDDTTVWEMLCKYLVRCHGLLWKGWRRVVVVVVVEDMAGGLVLGLGAGHGSAHDALVIVTLGLHQGRVVTTSGHTRGTFCFRSTRALTRADTRLLQ